MTRMNGRHHLIRYAVRRSHAIIIKLMTKCFKVLKSCEESPQGSKDYMDRRASWHKVDDLESTEKDYRRDLEGKP